MTTTAKTYPAAICWHEAGHVVAAENLLGGFRRARVAPRGDRLGAYRGGGLRGLSFGVTSLGAFRHTTTDPINWAILYAAGPIAQDQATHKGLGKCISFGGQDDWRLFRLTCDGDRAMADRALRMTRFWVRRWWPQIERVAGHLRREGIIFGRDFGDVVGAS
jgi:hypothetical protein